jgi:hypothetical protein
VTLELPPDAPALTQPWIITFGPLGTDDEWEPVVCGPYERAHALALAESVISDEELVAVVEPVQPHVSVDQIRDEIVAARVAASQADESERTVTARETPPGYGLGAQVAGRAPSVGGGPAGSGRGADGVLAGSGRGAGDGWAGSISAAAAAEAWSLPSQPPTADEVRAGFARLTARLAG